MTDERRLCANSDVKSGPSPGLGLGEVSQNARVLIHWGFCRVLRKNSLVLRNFVNYILILHCFQKSSWKFIQLETLSYFGSSSVWKMTWFKVLSHPVVSVPFLSHLWEDCEWKPIALTPVLCRGTWGCSVVRCFLGRVGRSLLVLQKRRFISVGLPF